MTDFIVKVQYMKPNKFCDDESAFDAPMRTKLFLAQNVERLDKANENPLLNFWVKDPDGGSTMYQVSVDEDWKKNNSDFYFHAHRAWVETLQGARIESLSRNVYPSMKAVIESEQPLAA